MILAENVYDNKKWYNKINSLIEELGLYDW